MHSVGASHNQTQLTSRTSRASRFFYKLLSFLTWPSGYPNSLQYLFLIASNVQYILILLTIQLDHFGTGLNSGLALTVNKICKALLLRNLTDAQIDGWTLVAYIYLSSLLIGTCLLIFLAARRKKASRKTKHMIVTISQFHLTIAFWVCNAILLYSLTDARDYHMKFFKIPFDRSALMAWHIFLLVLNFLLGGIFAMYSYDPLKWSNEMAISTPVSHVLTFALKGIVCLILLLIDEGNAGQKWLLGIVSVIISGCRHFHLIVRFPYYEYRPLKASLLMSSIGVLISFLSILILCFHDIEALNGNAIFYMEALILCLGVKCSQIYFENKVLEYLGTLNLRSEDDVLKKIFAIYYMRRNTRLTLSDEEHFSMKEIQFWGVWTSYSEHEKFTNEKVNAVPRIIEEAFDARVYELLSSSVEKFKENKKLKLLLANFILHQPEGMLKGLDCLQQLRGEGGFLRVKSEILWEEYQKKLESKYEGNLDIRTFLQFEENSRNLVEMIYLNSKRYVDFWKIYAKPSLELIELVHQSERIEEEDVRITKFWNNFEAKEKYLQKEFLTVYTVYLSIVRNATHAASKLKKKLIIYERNIGNNVEEQDVLSQETLMSADNFAFHISMEKESFGRIVNVSENAGRKLGWRKNELISKNLEMMIPRFLRKESMTIFKGGDGKTLKDPIVNRVIECFLLGSENWIVPCYGFFCLYPNIKEELKILSLFRLKKNCEELVIVNSRWIVQGATERIGELLELEGMLEKISLELICPGFAVKLFEENSLKNKIIVNFNVKGKIVLKDCCVTVEEYPVTEKYFVLKFLPNDILKAEKQNKKKSLKSEQKIPEKLQTQLELLSIQEQEEDEEAIPSEKLLREFEFTVNSPVTSTRNLITPHQKMIPMFDFSTPRTATKRMITTLGDNQQTAEDLLLVKYTSEPSVVVVKEEGKKFQRYQSKKSEDYNKETSVVSSQASSQRIELEEVLHVKPKDYSMRALNISFGVYITAAIILLISFKVLHENSLDIMTKNAEVSTAVLLRLMRLCNLYAQAGAIVKLDEGTLFADRFRFMGVPNLRASTVLGIPLIVTNLLDSNNQLRQYVSKIEEKFEKDLYPELPMFFYNQSGAVVANQTTNPFELIDLLVATADRISHTSFLLVRGNSPDIQFIYKNSVDRLLVLSEQGLEVVVADTETKLDELFHSAIYFFVVMGIFGLALFGFFMYIANKVVQDQKKTFELFRRLDEDEIRNHTRVVEFFCSIISQSDMNIQIAAKKIQQKQSFFSENFETKPANLRKGKRLNMQGVYSTLSETILAVLVLLFVVFSGYIVILALVKSQNGIISTKVNLLTSFNFQAYEQSLLKFVLPDYLGGHVHMTFRSQPFMEEWDRTYERNLKMGDSLLQIIDPEKGFGDDEMLVELVTGNLCEIIVTDNTKALKALGLGDPCDKIVNGVARKGVKAAYDYSMYWMQSALANFEASGKTKLDSIKALNATGQKQMEVLGILYVRTAMERISNRMEAQLQKDADKFIHAVLVVMVVYVLVYTTVVLVVWFRIQKVFARLRIKWKRLFKLVPEGIILSNKALKMYLLKSKNGNHNWMD